MDISEIAVRLLLLFFPGIICYFVVDALIVHRERKTHEIFLLTLVYGVLSYVVYAIPCALWTSISGSSVIDGKLQFPIPPNISFLNSLTDPDVKPDIFEIGLVSLVALFVGLAVSAAINRKWLYDVARRFGITRRFAELNVWSFALNAGEVQWANIRDLENNFMFQGYLKSFSDVEDVAELLMTDVTVFNETTGAELYKADRMYLSRRRDELTVEFPIQE